MLFYLVIVFLFIYFWFKKKFEFWQCQGFPSVPATIPFGSTSDFNVHTSDFFKKIYDENKGKYPAIGFYFLATPVLLPIEPALVKEIFSISFDSFHERGFYHNFKARESLLDNQIAHNFHVPG